MGKYLMKVALLKQHPEDKCTTFPKQYCSVATNQTKANRNKVK